MKKNQFYDWDNSVGVNSAISILNSSAHLVPFNDYSSSKEDLINYIPKSLPIDKKGKQLPIKGFEKEK